MKHLPDSAIIITRDYCGYHHPALEVKAVLYGEKGENVGNKFDIESPNSFVNGKNKFKKNVIYLQT